MIEAGAVEIEDDVVDGELVCEFEIIPFPKLDVAILSVVAGDEVEDTSVTNSLICWPDVDNMDVNATLDS